MNAPDNENQEVVFVIGLVWCACGFEFTPTTFPVICDSVLLLLVIKKFSQMALDSSSAVVVPPPVFS